MSADVVNLPGTRRARAIGLLRAQASPWLMVTVLAVLLLLTASWTILAGGWVPRGTPVPLAAVTAVLEGALLARCGARRLLVALAAPLMLVVAVVPFTLSTIPLDGSPGLGHVAHRYAAAMLGGLLSSTDWPFIVGLCSILWLCGYWAGWFAAAERNGVAAILPCLIVIAINDINAPSTLRVPLPQMATLVVAMLLVGACGFGAAHQRWRLRRLPGPAPAARRALYCALPLALVVATVGQTLPPFSNHALSSFFQTFGDSGHGTGNGSGSGPGNGLPGSGGPVIVGFSPLTQPGGALTASATSVLEYTTSSPGGVYLQGAVDSVDVDGDWSPLPHNYRVASVRWRSLPLRSGEAVPQEVASVDGGAAAATTFTSVDLRYVGPISAATPIFYPGDPVTSSIPTTVLGEAGAGGGYVEVDEATASAASTQATLAVTAVTSNASASQLEQSAAFPVSPVANPYPEWLSLTDQAIQDPEGISAINQLAAQWTNGATTVYAAAADIEKHLRNTALFHYTLTPPSPPRGVEPLVYFLEVSHQGYCQYYASAMGEMLRSLGIPTRLVTGYGPGTAMDQGGTTVHAVSTADAHVWVEVDFPGYGWVPFEPTPPSTLGDYQTFTRGGSNLPANLTPPPVPTLPPTAAPTPSAKPVPHHSTGAAHGSALTSPWGEAALVLLLLLLALAAALWWLARPSGAAAAWRRMLLVGRFFGVVRRPSETIAEVGERLLATLPPPLERVAAVRQRADSALRELTVLCGREVFARAPLDMADQLRARACWKSVLQALPSLVGADLRRRLRRRLPAR